MSGSSMLPSASSTAGFESDRFVWGYMKSQSWLYISTANPICRVFERHAVRLADSVAAANTGKRIAARMAMIAMTTKSSIRVKALSRCIVVIRSLLRLRVYDRELERQGQWIEE